MRTIIHTPTSKLEKSIDFYTRLNFKIISKENPLLLSDGKAVVEVNPDRFARAGVKMYKNSWAAEISQLEKIVSITPIEGGNIISDPSGMWIYLLNSNTPLQNSVENKSYGLLGNFSGLSLETTDINKSAQILEILGFSKRMGAIEQGWITYSDDEGFSISLMIPLACPHLFFNPSMTYFNGKNNLSIIDKIRTIDIPITEEISYFNKEGIVDNIIIRDPGGYGFFIFSD